MIISLHSNGLHSVPADPAADPIRSNILACLADLGESPEQVSLAIGQLRGFLRGFLCHGTPVELPDEVRRQLALHLGIPETALF